MFSVEPGIYLEGETGVRIEDLILLDAAAGRVERLTQFPREVLVLHGSGDERSSGWPPSRSRRGGLQLVPHAPQRPYETWEYSVSMPRTMSGSGLSTGISATSGRIRTTSCIGTSTLHRSELPGLENIRVCSADAMLTMAQRALGRDVRPEPHRPRTRSPLGSMTGSVFSATGSGPDLRRGLRVFGTADGLARSRAV